MQGAGDRGAENRTQGPFRLAFCAQTLVSARNDRHLQTLIQASNAHAMIHITSGVSAFSVAFSALVVVLVDFTL
jgi:hypothetical protein